MTVAGIDLGTTFSKIAHVPSQGGPVLIPDAHDVESRQTPSVVYIGDQGCLVGQPVELLLDSDPELPVIRFVKLQLGHEKVAYTDPCGRKWSPEAISALILRKLENDARTHSGEGLDGVVITVPAQFGDSERRATRNAAALAELPVLKLIDEPVAAATYYGLGESKTDQTIFVYDLGGGTFDATIVQVSPQGLYVLATEGSSQIGGKWFDELIMEVVAAQFRQKHQFSPESDRQGEMQLRRLCEKLKKDLSAPKVAQLRRTAVLCGRAAEIFFTRAQLEILVSELINSTIEVCRRCLKGASLDWRDIDRVLLVGGSTMIPSIRDRVMAETGKGADHVLQVKPHHAVAYGAALLAARATGEKQLDIPELRQNIATSSLGIRTLDPGTGQLAVQTLIERNTPLPAQKTMTFYTTRPDQQRMVLELVQSKGPESAPNSLGHFVFGPFTRPRKNLPVEVRIAYDAEGLVLVTARDPDTGAAVGHQVDEREGTMVPSTFAYDRELVMGACVNN